MMKRLARKLVVLIREVPATTASLLADRPRAFTPRQEAKLAEMDRDYAALMRARGSKALKPATKILCNRTQPSRSLNQ